MSDLSHRQFWISLFRKIVQIILKNLGLSSRRKTHHQHVVPHPEGWAVKGEGNEKCTAVFELQKAAIRRAKEIARNYQADVIIHRKDGTIRERIGYG